MTASEKKLLAELQNAQERLAALAVLCERYKTGLEAAGQCTYLSDVEKIVNLLVKS